MARSNYIPDTDEAKAALFERFRDTLPSYSGLLGPRKTNWKARRTTPPGSATC